MTTENKPKAFHAIDEDNLDRIIAYGGKVISPSFGIAKNIETIEEYGDIVFGVSPAMLKNEKIYSRDIWSATFKDVPDKLIMANTTVLPNVSRVFRKYGVFRDENITLDQWVRDAEETNDPPDYMRSMALANDYNFDRHQEDIARDLGVQFTDDDIDDGNLPEKIADLMFTEVKKTPENIAKYLKHLYDAKRGVGSMFGGSQVSAQVIPFAKLEENYDKLQDTYDPKAKEKWFEDQVAAREKVSGILDPDGERRSSRFDIYPSDEMAGELAGATSFAQFKKILSEYGENPGKYSQKDLTEAYRVLREAYVDIPSEYFEAKSFKVFDLNDFPYVITSNKSAVEKLRRAGYRNPIYRDYPEYYASVGEARNQKLGSAKYSVSGSGSGSSLSRGKERGLTAIKSTVSESR